MRALLGLLLTVSIVGSPSIASSQEGGDDDAPVVVIPEPPYYIGRQFVYAVLLPEGDPEYVPEEPLPESPGIAVQFIDSRGFEQDGRKVRLYRFNVLPLQAGELFLPPIHFRSNNRRISTDLRKLQVLEPVESDEVSVKNTLSQTECYEGQPLQFKFSWEMTVPASRIHAVEIDVPLMTHPEFRLVVPPPPPGLAADGSIGLPVSKTRIVANIVGKEINFFKTVIPLRPGKFRLQPSVLLCSINRDEDSSKRGGFQYPSYFDNQFFQTEEGSKYERVYTRATPLELNVLPLPKDNRPSLFNGQFGPCKLDVEVKPTEIRAGDPVTIVVTMSDHPFVETIELPHLGDMPGFDDAFEVPEVRSPGVVKGRVKRFRQSVIARHAGIKELPPIRLAYFDPVKGEFQTQISEPVPLAVKAALTGVTVLNDGTLLRNEVEAEQGGVRHNYLASDVIAWKPGVANGLGGPVVWILVLLVPPLMFLITFFATRHSRWARRDPSAARAAVAAKRFYRRVSGDPPAREVVAATRGYLGDKLGIGEANLTADEATEALEDRGIGEETVQQVIRLFADGEGKLFSRNANGSGAAAILGAAKGLVKDIEGRLAKC